MHFNKYIIQQKCVCDDDGIKQNVQTFRERQKKEINRMCAFGWKNSFCITYCRQLQIKLLRVWSKIPLFFYYFAFAFALALAMALVSLKR